MHVCMHMCVRAHAHICGGEKLTCGSQFLPMYIRHVLEIKPGQSHFVPGIFAHGAISLASSFSFLLVLLTSTAGLSHFFFSDKQWFND